jgi:hypothetical protein
MNYSQRDQKPQNMNQRVEQRKSGVAHASSCTCYSCDLFSNIHNNVLFPLNIQSCYLYSMSSYVYSCLAYVCLFHSMNILIQADKFLVLVLHMLHEHRIVYLKGKGHCYGCLKRGHMSNMCKKKSTCAVCSRQHPTILHNYNLCFNSL